MSTLMLAKLEEAILNVINDCSDDGYWEHYIYEDLETQMALAAAQVFDASQKGQQFMLDNKDHSKKK